MSALRSLILGGTLLCLAFTAAAESGPEATAEPVTVELRPLSRSDALAAEAAARREHLSSVRPVARPAHMLRYPVRVIEGPPPVRPPARIDWVPPARWDFHSDGERWTRAAMSAIRSHGGGLEDIVPRDIATWCPAYRQNSALQRRAFWVGMMSALAKHESTWRPGAVGGNGRWFGLLQIFPDTARRYGCRARTGAALTDPEDNLSCAVRIMGVTVRRDNAIALRDGRWRGVAADWGPMTNRRKIAEMAAWTREQSYCQPNLAVMASLRPQMRPVVETVSTMGE